MFIAMLKWSKHEFSTINLSICSASTVLNILTYSLPQKTNGTTRILYLCFSEDILVITRVVRVNTVYTY